MLCYKCHKDKPVGEFPRDKTTPRGYHGYCKECRTANTRKRKRWLDPAVKQQFIETRRQVKLKSIEYKGGNCIDCGYNKHPAALCFHHVEGDKENDVGQLMKFGFTDKLKYELDKCVLLCHNCHDIRHYGTHKGNWKCKEKETLI